MKTRIYIDGFNLYFGALHRTKFKWLNPVEAVRRHLDVKHEIIGAKYFTAKINHRPHDPEQPLRQEAYLRALATLPDFQIYFGHFLTKNIKMPVAMPEPGQPTHVVVIKTEEKGSDVNLASQLLNDAHLRRMECAVVISGDSDLLMPVKIVGEEMGIPVGVLNPQKNPCVVLKRHATFYKHLKPGRLAKSQFPEEITDVFGIIRKPSSW
jgi:hypothetical protein